METIFWAPTKIIDDYAFYLAFGGIGMLASVIMAIQCLIKQIVRRELHVVFLISILGFGLPILLELVGVDTLTSAMRSFVVWYALLGFCILIYGVASNRAGMWISLYVLPAVSGTSIWLTLIGVAITAAI